MSVGRSEELPPLNLISMIAASPKTKGPEKLVPGRRVEARHFP